MHKLSDYDYDLPEELLAKHPPEQREDARLLVVNRQDRSLTDHSIVDLPTLLSSGDCMVLNDTRVIPARLFGVRTNTGGKWEGLFLDAPARHQWRLIGETRGRLQPGESLTLHPAHDPDSTETLLLELLSRDEEGVWTVRPVSDAEPEQLLEQFGTMPLPPYIGRRIANDEDRTRYQTTFAREPGAVAAPTAGLHLTPDLLQRCRAAQIDHQFVTLHVGIGTFRPVSASQLDDHVMHSERCELKAETAARLNDVRAAGGRVIAIGTTTVRTLESAARGGTLTAFSGETDIFIRPPHQFQAIDGLLTNFHLPRSTLLMLVSAFADVKLIRAAYAHAISQRYRFYSYGDAMLIV